MLKASLSSKKNLLKLPGLRLPVRPDSQPQAHWQPLSKPIASRTWRAYSSVPSAEQSPPTTHTQRTLKRHHPKIRTLDPAKLTADDYLDFSSKSQPTVRIISQSTDSTARSYIWTFSCASGSDWSSRAYPPGTHGFMYYHVPASSSPLAGELRFRITLSRDPASFATGSDLLTERGKPWRYPLYKIMVRPDSYREIAALLLQDGLVSQRTLDLAAAAAPSLRWKKTVLDVTRKANLVSALPTLSAFGQEFTYHFAVHSSCLCLFVGPEAIFKQHIWRVAQFRVWVDGKPVQYCPFEGPVICCFERSNLPEHTGKRVVVIRVRRIIDIKRVPAPDGCTYPEELMPREGELLNVMFHGKVRPWAVDVDGEGKVKRALRVFFENEELYGSI